MDYSEFNPWISKPQLHHYWEVGVRTQEPYEKEMNTLIDERWPWVTFLDVKGAAKDLAKAWSLQGLLSSEIGQKRTSPSPPQLVPPCSQFQDHYPPRTDTMSLLDRKVLISSRPLSVGKRSCWSDRLRNSNLLAHVHCNVGQKPPFKPSFPCLLCDDPSWTQGWVGTSVRVLTGALACNGCPFEFQIVVIIMTMTLVTDATLATMKPS